MRYECGTCGDGRILIDVGEYLPGGSDIEGVMPIWRIRCGNGHEWVAIPGAEYEIVATVVRT